MICEDVVLDASNLIPMEIPGSLVSTRQRNQSSAVMELGKKLLQSCREGDTQAVLDLMTKGAPFTTDWLGTSPLHLAAMNNHYETCDVLLRAGIGKDGRTKVDKTPLHFAAYEGHSEIAKLLLEHGVDVDCKDMLHMTPLHWAVERGHEECVRVLLNSGASPHAISRFLKTPISIAVEMEWVEMAEMLQMTTTLEATQSIENVEQQDDIEDSEPQYITDSLQDEDILNIASTKPDTSTTSTDEMDVDGMDAERDAQNTLAALLPQISTEKFTDEATLQLWKDHGITMLPHDNTNTVTSAVQSGRKIILSEAGKLVLKDTKLKAELKKPPEIKSKPIILPAGKLKSTKIYTMSSSQFLAMTGQAKPNILQKVPIDSIKKAVASANAGVNFIQVPKTSLPGHIANVGPLKLQPKPVTLANSINVKPMPGTITVVKKAKGSMVTIPSSMKGEILNLNQLARKPNVIQLKAGSPLGNAVKIVVNKNNLGKIISHMPVNPKLITNGGHMKETPNLIKIEKIISNNNINTNSDSNLKEIERLKSELRSTKLEVELYKKKLEAVQAEMQSYKDKLCCHNLLDLETETIQ